MSEIRELSELSKEQLIEIIRESSELVGVMRADRERVLDELEEVVAENHQLVAERQAREAELDIIEPGREDNTFEEGKALLDRFKEATGGEGFLENSPQKDQLQAELGKQLERAEDLVEEYAKKHDELKSERDALKLELESAKQAKRIAAAEADQTRAKRDEASSALREAQEEAARLRRDVEASDAKLQAAVKERDDAMVLLSVRKQFDEKGTETREGSKSNSPAPVPRLLRQVIEDLLKAQQQLESDEGLAQGVQALLAGAIEDLRGFQQDDQGAAASYKDESLVLLERRGGLGTSNQASGITLLRADPLKESQFNSRLPSEKSKQSPPDSQMNSEMVKKLNLSPFLAPDQDSQANEGQFKFSARTFGLQEGEFETLQNEDQQTLLLRYIRQAKDASEYAQAKEAEIAKLAGENQMLREAIEELVHKREKVEEVAERLEDLDKEELLDLAKELLEKIDNQHGEIESLRRRDANIFFPSGGARKLRYDSEGREVSFEEASLRKGGQLGLRDTRHDAEARNGPAEPTSDPIRIVEEIDPDVQRIIDLYEAQISNDRALIDQMKAELEDCSLKLAEQEMEKNVQNKAVDRMSEEILALRDKNKQLLKLRQLQESDLQDLKLRNNCDFAPSAPDSEQEDLVLQEIKLGNRRKDPQKDSRKGGNGDKENSTRKNQTAEAGNSSNLKDSFGRERLERGLTSIHMKLMEYINKNYSLKTKEAQLIHKDLAMKMIDVNRMIEALCNRLNEYKKTDLQARSAKAQLKPLVSGGKKQEKSRDAGRAESYQRTSAQQESKVAKRLFTKSTDHKIDRDLRSHSKVSIEGDPASATLKENQSENFVETIKVLTSNSDVITKRGHDLVSEYRKIDDNITQLVRYLSSKKKPQLGKLAKYRNLLVDSELEALKTQIKQIHAEDIEVRVSVKNLLKSSASHLKAKVNQIKNKTKDRRDQLASLVQKDQIEVEGLVVAPKHR